MRYLLLLFFASASVSAMCPFGDNVGRFPIGSPSTICYKYSQSSLGGCFATCTGACVELPNANPPSVGPYTSTGSECKSGGGDGGGNGGGDGGNVLPPLPNNIPDTWVGPNRETNFAPALTVMTGSINQGLGDLGSKLDMSGHVAYLGQQLESIVRNTGSLGGGGTGNYDHEILGYIKSSYDLSAADSARTTAHRSELIGTINDIRKDISYMNSWPQQESYLERILASINNSGGGGSGDGKDYTQQLTGISQSLEIISWNVGDDLLATEAILAEIKKSGGSGGSGEGGDKPCTGPLCSFNKPSGSSGSALSKVFSNESIDDVKKQIENKDTEISDAMNDVKSVFAPEELTITGTYNNDYHDINGVRVDLSGKSNLELFLIPALKWLFGSLLF